MLQLVELSMDTNKQVVVVEGEVPSLRKVVAERMTAADD